MGGRLMLVEDSFVRWLAKAGVIGGGVVGGIAGVGYYADSRVKNWWENNRSAIAMYPGVEKDGFVLLPLKKDGVPDLYAEHSSEWKEKNGNIMCCRVPREARTLDIEQKHQNGALVYNEVDSGLPKAEFERQSLMRKEAIKQYIQGIRSGNLLSNTLPWTRPNEAAAFNPAPKPADNGTLIGVLGTAGAALMAAIDGFSGWMTGLAVAVGVGAWVVPGMIKRAGEEPNPQAGPSPKKPEGETVEQKNRGVEAPNPGKIPPRPASKEAGRTP